MQTEKSQGYLIQQDSEKWHKLCMQRVSSCEKCREKALLHCTESKVGIMYKTLFYSKSFYFFFIINNKLLLAEMEQ